MQASGALVAPPVDAGAHACWRFDDDADFRDAAVQYELAIDRLISTEPMSALCAYDVRVLGSAVADLVAVHPLHHGAEACEPFRAYHEAGRLRLTGEVDLADRDVFALVVGAVRSGDDHEVVVDLGELQFIDVRGLSLLAQLATQLRSCGRSLRVSGAAPIVRRCWDLLGLDSVVPREVAP
jgi:anti-anti-sigma factor